MDVFDLFARITLDSSEYEKQLGEAGSKTGGFADKLKSGLATAGKVAAAGVAAATTAVVALGKSAIDGFADYEQLVGGVETLFGSGGKNIEEYAASVGKTVEEVRGEFNQLMIAEQTVMENANNAFSSAGLSANEYMETVTSFSASLIQSLGGDTVAAASYANQAIIDMADNANKMGSSMESIQNAYQGFAKQNYTMLDNLKLGYGGTQSEMYRLMKDAEALGAKFNSEFYLTSKGTLVADFADITEAIHVIQTNMGITGTTAEEAAGTISGSAATMKAAWENLLVGIADDSQNFDQLIENLVTSATAFGDNILPRISVALGGVVNLISGLAPVLIEAIPLMIEQILPQLLSGIDSLVSSVVEVLPGIVSTIATVIGQQSHYIIQSGLDLILMLGQSLVANTPVLVDTVIQVVDALAMWLTEYSMVLMETGVSILTTLAKALTDNLPTLIPAITESILFIAEELTNPEQLSNLVDAAIDIMIALAEGILKAMPVLLEQAPVIVANLLTALLDNVPKLYEASAEMIGQLVIGIFDLLPQIGESAANIVTRFVSTIINMRKNVMEVGRNIVEGVWNGISERVSWFTNKVMGFFSGIVNGVKDALGIHSPSKVFASIGGYMAEGLGEGWGDGYKDVKRQIENGMDFGTASVNFSSSGIGKKSVSTYGEAQANDERPIVITVQSILDGKVIGETAYRYQKNKQMAYGG